MIVDPLSQVSHCPNTFFERFSRLLASSRCQRSEIAENTTIPRHRSKFRYELKPYFAGFDVFCGFCRSGSPHQHFLTFDPRNAALNSNKNTHNAYDYHTTLIGFVAAPEIAPF